MWTITLQGEMCFNMRQSEDEESDFVIRLVRFCLQIGRNFTVNENNIISYFKLFADQYDHLIDNLK